MRDTAFALAREVLSPEELHTHMITVNQMVKDVSKKQTLRWIVYYLFHVGLDGVCRDPFIKRSERTMRKVRYFIDAIREAYAANFYRKFGRQLDSVLLDGKENLIHNCEQLYEIVKSMGLSGIQLNGACE